MAQRAGDIEDHRRPDRSLVQVTGLSYANPETSMNPHVGYCWRVASFKGFS